MNAQALIWLLIAITAALDAVMYPIEGMSVTMDCRGPVLYLLALVAMVKLTQRRYPAASHVANTFIQLFVFSQAGGYLTYVVMAATPFPLADAFLSHADAFLGFDWPTWFTWVHSHPTLHLILALAYVSIPLQLFVLVAYCAFVDPDRLDELVLGGITTIALTMVGLIFLPAIGAWTEHGIGMVEPWKHDILALRAHKLLVVAKTDGIISFPSFHTASAVLLVNMARRHKLFAPVLLLNVLLIASVMSEGAHYFVDMLSGFLVALAAIAITRQVLDWCRQTPIRTASTAPGLAGGLAVVAIGDLPARQ